MSGDENFAFERGKRLRLIIFMTNLIGKPRSAKSDISAELRALMSWSLPPALRIVINGKIRVFQHYRGNVDQKCCTSWFIHPPGQLLASPPIRQSTQESRRHAQAAFLDRKEAPNRKDPQQALERLKFKLALDDASAPLKTSGYPPCALEGEDAGFDIRFQKVEAYFLPIFRPSGANRRAGHRDRL